MKELLFLNSYIIWSVLFVAIPGHKEWWYHLVIGAFIGVAHLVAYKASNK